MKKLISILAIAVVSMNFVSCRQDDVTSEMDNMTPQESISKRGTDTIKKDSTTSNAAQRPVDPDPPVKDGTSW